MIARATISRWAMPPDNSLTFADRAIREAELLEQPCGPVVGLAGVHPEVAAVEVEVLADVERAVERVGLRNDTDHLLGGRGPGHDVDAGDERPPLARDDPRRQHPDSRGLARAVRAQ